MSIKLTGSQDWGRVTSYVISHKNSNLYHDSRWGNIVEKCFGHKYFLLLSENAHGEIDGVLPLVHMKSWSFGNFMVSMPYFNYGGVCANDKSTPERLIDEAVRMAKDLKVQHIEFRQEGSLNNGFPEKTHKVSMRLGLPDSFDELWKSFPSKLRSQIKVPQKAGMSCSVGRLEELDGFYTVFSVNMRYLGTPVYPKIFFPQHPRSVSGKHMDSHRLSRGYPRCVRFSGRVQKPAGNSLGFLRPEPQPVQPEYAALLVLPEIRLREGIHDIRFRKIDARREHLQIQGAVGRGAVPDGLELLGPRREGPGTDAGKPEISACDRNLEAVASARYARCLARGS